LSIEGKDGLTPGRLITFQVHIQSCGCHVDLWPTDHRVPRKRWYRPPAKRLYPGSVILGVCSTLL